MMPHDEFCTPWAKPWENQKGNLHRCRHGHIWQCRFGRKATDGKIWWVWYRLTPILDPIRYWLARRKLS